jgi:hypothetical protein
MTLCGQKVVFFASEVLTAERHAFTPPGSQSLVRTPRASPVFCSSNAAVPLPRSKALLAAPVHSISRVVLSSMWVDARL